ncbi:hypothetical protein GCM10022415_20280 [Knoellia locipacati]|uniref:Uncharacterized protein n=1 Tax=Knoellia locipacati TaxID=882824 RepID=A0A512T1A1_9MICO|nr:hypothetical protein [Knoellia locipacati]GEQ13977.1 hypothetical protein KLO01_20240 [Knoellia locipacati]
MLRVKSAAPSDRYDLLLGTLGYEPRCIQVPSKLAGIADSKLAWAFDSKGVLAFDENHAWYSDAGFPIAWGSESSLTDALTLAISPFAQRGGDLSLAIDISCMSRNLIAELLLALDRLADGHSIFVDFWYSPAQFDPAASKDATIQIAKPISPEFAGITSDPLLPVSAVIGVGYEPNLALGVSEYLDAAQVYAFSPRGHDPGFDEASDAANSTFFLAPNLVRRSEYDIRRPLELYARLESLTYGISRNSRVAVVPLGPKIFALCALLVAMRSDQPLTVWRFSGGDGINVRPTRAGGEPVHLSVHFFSESGVHEGWSPES